MTAPDPETLERLRRSLALRMGATGELTIQGEAIRHERTRAAIRAGLDTSDRGETIVRIGEQWGYIEIVDLPLRILALRLVGQDLRARLDDGRETTLDPHTLAEDDLGLRAEVDSRWGRRLGARLHNHAVMDLHALLESDVDPPTLRIGTQRVTIPRVHAKAAEGSEGQPSAQR